MYRHRVLFDDGCIHAVGRRVEKKRGDYQLRVVRTQKQTANLRGEKSINLPDTLTTVPSLSDEDLRALASSRSTPTPSTCRSCARPRTFSSCRGDLAVEVGFERLAELREEILGFCQASHVPAIWATQVLDTLARTDVSSRAEVTDAAASVAAECVMLNDGPYAREAVAALSDALRRMEKHRDKKRSVFRKLRVTTLVAPRIGTLRDGDGAHA